MEKGVKKNMTKFLYNNYNAMAYYPADMKGVSKKVIKLKLNMKKKAKVVKQKKRDFTPDK